MLKTAGHSGKTDEELVLLTLQDQENYIYLIERYEEKLKRYIRRISNFCEDDIADILQDIFIKAYRNLRDFDRKLKFSSWIYRIAHNEVISKFRKYKARPQSVIAVDDAKVINKFAAEIDIEDGLDKEYLAKKMKVVFGKLDRKYREVLVLRFFEDKSYEEISDILRKSTGSVGTLVKRAKEKLKKEIKKSKTKF
ncbi:RNA polymerase sigma factor [Patescibacteria group bacterium]